MQEDIQIPGGYVNKNLVKIFSQKLFEMGDMKCITKW